MPRSPSPAGPVSKRRRTEESAQTSAYEELFHLIRSRPPGVAEQLVRKIRNGTKAEDLIRYVQDGDLLLNLALQPDHRFRFTLPYPADVQPLLQRTANPYLNSHLFRTLFEETGADHQSSVARASSVQPIYDIPYHAATLADPLLSSAFPHISKWTAVSDDEEFLKRAFEVYFQFDYSFYHWFHKDLFLNDLIAGRHEHCSSLLVNAIIATACHGITEDEKRAEFWNPASNGYLFLAEAKRLLELELNTAKLTTIQSLCTIGLVFSKNCLDTIGWSYWIKAVAMTEEMQLFGDLESNQTLTEESRLGYSFTAWGFFNLGTLVCFFFSKKPWWRSPPQTPFPDPKKTGEIWLLYPQTGTIVPCCLGYTFLAMTRLFIIMHDALWYTSQEQQDGSESTASLSLDKATDILKRLQQWKRSLPGPLLPSVVVLPPHIMLHFTYHTFVQKTFSTLIDLEQTLNASLLPNRRSTNMLFSPKALVAESESSIITLTHILYRFNGSEAYFSWYMGVFNHVAYMILPEVQQQRQLSVLSQTTSPMAEALRATFIMCVKSFLDQSHNHYISEVFFHLISPQLHKEDAAIITRNIDMRYQTEDRAKLMQTHVRAQFPVGMVNIAENVTEHRISHLVEQLGEMEVDGS